MFGLGGPEIILILVVILLLFGAKKLPELAKGLGSGIKEFKKATNDINEEVQRAMDQPATPPPSAAPTQTTASAAETSAQKDDAPKA